MKMKQSQKTRMKRRLHAYRSIGTNFVVFFESDFKGVFSPMLTEKEIDLEQGFGFAINELVEKATEEECLKLNQRLDCYQIDKRSRI